MERPEERKGNQIVEKVPEKILNIINELITKKNQLIQGFLNDSFRLGELQDKTTQTRSQIKSKNEQIGQKVKYAFDKLKLKKKKNYRWSYDGKGSFIGNEIPEPPATAKK